MNIFSKVINALTTIITFGVIAAAGVLFIPRIFGYQPYVVLSGSMEPQIHTGSVAFINSNDKDVEIGDIIAFTLPNDVTVTHRLVAYDPDVNEYVTKGDANDTVDMATVPQENIVGTYTMSIPKAGYILSDLTARTFDIGGFSIPRGPILIIFALLGMNIFSGVIAKISEWSDDDDIDDDAMDAVLQQYESESEDDDEDYVSFD